MNNLELFEVLIESILKTNSSYPTNMVEFYQKMSHQMRDRLKEFNEQIIKLLDENTKQQNSIQELVEFKNTLTQKYENCKQLNIELYTTLGKYRDKLKKVENDSDRKAKAIAVYIKNNDDIKNNLLRDKTILESEIKQLKTDLNDKKILCEKLESELNNVKIQTEQLCRQHFNEKNQLRLECQNIFETYKEENNKLLETNRQLRVSLEEAQKREEGNGKREKGMQEQIARLNLIIKGKERQKVIEFKSNKQRETKLKSEISLLRNRLFYMRRQSDLNKRESFSYKYKTIESKTLYSKSIEKLNKFSLQNNEEIFTAIIKVMDKMRVNSNQRLLDKTTKTLNDIKTKTPSIEESAKRISDFRNDSKINCGLCSESYGSKGFLELHMKTLHSICFDEHEKDT